SIFTIIQIAKVLDVSLDDLLGHKVTQESQNKQRIRFVYFDINGCLVRFFHHAFTKIAEDTGASSDVIESTFWHYNDIVCKGEMSLEDFNNALAEAVGVASIDWTAYYLEAIQPIAAMHDLVKWVAKRYKIGLLSNIMPGQIDAMINKGLLPDAPYETIVDSSQVKAIKPEQHMYEIAAQFANTEPEHILLIDDSRPNIMAAEKMGWRVLWFDDYSPENSIERIHSALRA
ncbi:hypothetical protein EB077_09825, partial [bacterium]|nr:hypothetical protein [bacterium]